MSKMGFPGGANGKEPTCQCRRQKRCRFAPWVGKIPWRRSWQPTPVFLPGESQGQRSLEGYSPWGHKESDMTEQLRKHTLSTLDKNSTFTLNGESWKRIFLSPPPPKKKKKTGGGGAGKKQYTKLQLLLSPSDSWSFKTVRPGLNFKEW